MPKYNQTNDNASYTNSHPKTEWQPIVNMIGSALLGLFLLACAFWPLERIPFWSAFIGASVNLFILLAMFFQAHITKQQWKAMQAQENRMIEQRELMKGQLEASRQGVKKTKELFDQNERSMQNAQSAYIAVQELKFSDYIAGEPYAVRFWIKYWNNACL